MNNEKQIPNFFIVGAPKSGTTSLHYYLDQHPDIIMAEKEIHYFGKDLAYSNRRPSKNDYFDSFSKNNGEQLNGDASIWYLYSKSFAEEVKAINPNAKIIILLRNPVEMIYSLHSQNIYDANEDELNFETALEKEALRKQGKALPKSGNLVSSTFYKDAGSFYTPVKNMIDSFGKSNVFIATYNDFKISNKTVYNDILSFLELKPFDSIDFSKKNIGKQIKNPGLHQAIKSPSKFKKSIVRILIPLKPLRKKIIQRLYENNLDYSQRPNIKPETEKALKAFFKPNIEQLQKLTGLDLSSWL